MVDKLKEYLNSKIDGDFNFEVEHWDNGNFDDSYSYGVDCGEQYTYKEILKFIETLESTKDD